VTAPAVVDVHGVTVTYGPRTAVDGATLRVAAGEVVALLGPSGAGKSSLLRCLNRLLRPSAGSGSVLGVDLDAPAAEWRRTRAQIAFVFQDHGTIDRLSAFRNVLAGRLGRTGIPGALGWASRADRRLALDALDRVGLRDRAAATVRTLSGGERQRVAVARAIAQQPRLVLADEPVASLDPRLAAEVLDLLRAAAGDAGAACLISLHQVHLARRFADRIVALRQGCVVFDGLASTFDPGAHHAVYDVDDEPSGRPASGGPGQGAAAARVAVAQP
jgi:phosphonate transport system ATP-binding protein